MTEPTFHGLRRAPKASRPVIMVKGNDAALSSPLAHFGLLALDIGVGEPGHERVVLKVTKTGAFELPENVTANDLVSVRALDLAGTGLTISVAWVDPK